MPQINITVGKATIDKIDALKQQYGSRSQAVAVAIDRLWIAENNLDIITDAPNYRVAKDGDGA